MNRLHIYVRQVLFAVLTTVLQFSVMALPGFGAAGPQEIIPRSIEFEKTGGPPGGRTTRVRINPYTNDLFARVTGSGLYISGDQGESWIYPEPNPDGNQTAFLADGTIYASRYVSFNNGFTWSETSLSDSVIVRSVAASDQTGTAIAGSKQGLYRSTNSGAT